MTPFALCTFAAAAGSTLESYAVSGEAPWLQNATNPAGAKAYITTAGRVRGDTANGGGFYYAISAPTTNEYDVEVDSTYVASTGNRIFDGIFCRMNTAASTCYEFAYDSDPARGWYINKRVNGSQSPTYGTIQTIAVGQTVRRKLTVRNSGSSAIVTGYADGVQVVQIVDATPIVAAGRAGIDLPPATDTTGMHYDNFRATAAPVVIAPNDARILWSPGNVCLDGSGFAHVTQNASYFKVRFTGTSLAVLLDISTYHANSIPQSGWGQWVVSVDGKPPKAVVVSDPGAGVATTLVMLTDGLTDGVQHSIQAWFDLYDENDTFAPKDEQIVRQFWLDNGAILTAPAARPRSIMVEGDSIIKGYDTQDVLGVSPSVNYPPKIVATLLGDALDAEVGCVGLSGQGYVHTYNAWTGVFADTFGFYSAGHARVWPTNLTALLLCEGQNDVQGTHDVTAAAQAIIGTARTAVGASTWIFVVVPIAGTHRSELTAAVAQYKAAHPSDDRVVLLDPSDQTYPLVDGTHPTTAGMALYAANLAAKVAPYLTVAVNLPPAAGYPLAGFIEFLDPTGATSLARPLSLAPGAGDTLNGDTKAVPALSGVGSVRVYSDGSHGWKLQKW